MRDETKLFYFCLLLTAFLTVLTTANTAPIVEETTSSFSPGFNDDSLHYEDACNFCPPKPTTFKPKKCDAGKKFDVKTQRCMKFVKK